MNSEANPSPPARRYAAEVSALVTAMILLAAYPLLRYGGRWGETDSATFTKAIQAVFETGRLVNNQYVYANGYGYQALSVFVMQVGGITAAQFQLYVQFFLTAWIAFPAWLLYRELTGSGRGATLATAILFVQPEFLFFLLRGTHEKFTRGLILLALYLFAKSLAQQKQGMRLASYLLAFYLTLYGTIALNNLLSSSLITALFLALVLLVVLQWWIRSKSVPGHATERRLLYAVLLGGMLAFLYTFFLYPPARSNLFVFKSMLDRTAILLLDVESSSSNLNPYAYTARAWISQPVYLALSIANWILLAVSAAIWLGQSFKLVGRRAPGWEPGQLLLWSLYGAFAIQEALSIVVDFSGALASNLQVRAFPAFVTLGAPVIASAMLHWQSSGIRFRRVAWSGTITILAVLAVLSVLKATNEPLVSNKWSFYIPAEMQALDRAGIILTNRTIWTGFDERLITAGILRDPVGWRNKNLVAWNLADKNALVSDVIQARGRRWFMAPPIEADSFIVYDNGQAQLYHLRPRTPFQH